MRVSALTSTEQAHHAHVGVLTPVPDVRMSSGAILALTSTALF